MILNQAIAEVTSKNWHQAIALFNISHETFPLFNAQAKPNIYTQIPNLIRDSCRILGLRLCSLVKEKLILLKQG
jgi:hypothetical protein